jgi:hypothetical protein
MRSAWLQELADDDRLVGDISGDAVGRMEIYRIEEISF